MTYVSAGKECELSVYFNPPGNSERGFGKTRWLAQTFPLLSDTWPDYIVVKYRASSPEVFLHVSIKATAPSGAPTGPDLISVTVSPHNQNYQPYQLWAAFYTSPLSLLPPATYAIVAWVPDAPDNLRYHWQSQEATELYPAGKAWHSNDDGASWAELPTTDLLFELWGRPSSAPNPQPDVISNWAILTIAYYNSFDGVIITVTTDNPCHLYIRISDQFPQKHIHPAESRGAQVQTYIDQCFVAYTDIEQTEPGDTLVHIFDVAPWETCQTKWFYFWGTKRRQPVPSATPIFVYHKKSAAAPPIPWTLLLTEPWLGPVPQPGYALLLYEPWTPP